MGASFVATVSLTATPPLARWFSHAPFPSQPVRQGDVQADAGASSWADAAALVGSWTLDPGASDSPEPLHALLGYGWAERLAASCLTRLAVEEEEEENEGTVWRLGVHAEGMVLSGAALDERYPQDGSAVVLPRRDASRWSDSGEALESATACAVPRDGGVQLVHLLGAPRAGTLREWLGVTVEEDGREALVRQTQLRLKGGLGEWEGISVYRRLEEPQQGLPDAASAPSGAVAAPGALRMAARRRRRSAGGVDDVDNTPLGDELAFRSEQQFEQALRRAIKPQREAHELESPPALQSEQQSGGEMDAVEEIVTAAPAPLVAMADALLDNLPRMFGGFRSREATQAERAALTAVALGSMRLGVERQSEQTVELTAPTPVVSAKPMLPGSERAELAAGLESRRR